MEWKQWVAQFRSSEEPEKFAHRAFVEAAWQAAAADYNSQMAEYRAERECCGLPWCEAFK